MNKYQNALNHLCQYEIAYKVSCKESIETLQELIDKNTMLEKFDKVLFFNSNGFVVEGISYAQLERALDKACKKIQFYDSMFPNALKTNMSKEEWKEWLLNEK